MSLLSSHSIGPSALGLLADTVNDASSTRKLYLIALGLALLGGVLLIVTVWFWRSTRPEPELLAPLEQMGARTFRQLDGRAQKELLDSVRPEDAQPMRWGVVHGDPMPGTEIDLEAAARADMIGYDDLREPETELEAELDPESDSDSASASASDSDSVSDSEPDVESVDTAGAALVDEPVEEPEVPAVGETDVVIPETADEMPPETADEVAEVPPEVAGVAAVAEADEPDVGPVASGDEPTAADSDDLGDRSRSAVLMDPLLRFPGRDTN